MAPTHAKPIDRHSGPVVAGLDSSSLSDFVLRAADRWADRFGRPLVLTRIVRLPNDLPDAVLRLAPPEAEVELASEARRELQEKWSACCAQCPDADIVVASGAAWDGLCATARERDASYIVLGGHGYASLPRVVGTTLSWVIRNSPCHVLVARPHPADGDGTPRPIRRIVVGLDLSPRSPSVIDEAVRIAQAMGSVDARLSLVHVPSFPPERGAHLDHALPFRQALRQHGQEMLDEWGAKLPNGLVDRTCVSGGSPWRVLCERAENERADLIVIGARPTSAFDNVFGTTAWRVADRAPCSVVVATGFPNDRAALDRPEGKTATA